MPGDHRLGCAGLSEGKAEAEGPRAETGNDVELLAAVPQRWQEAVTEAVRERVGQAVLSGAFLLAMAGLSAKKRLTKPLLFGSILCALATAFVFRHSFFPEIEELRAREYQRYEEKRQEVLQRRQQQLAELPQKRTAS